MSCLMGCNLLRGWKFRMRQRRMPPVEQQRDLSRAGFTDPEGIEFDHDEPGGSLPSVPASLWH
eukprot:1161440-Pelagomonas_calceolata.AAC.7